MKGLVNQGVASVLITKVGHFSCADYTSAITTWNYPDGQEFDPTKTIILVNIESIKTGVSEWFFETRAYPISSTQFIAEANGASATSSPYLTFTFIEFGGAKKSYFINRDIKCHTQDGYTSRGG